MAQVEYDADNWPVERWKNFAFTELACREKGTCRMDENTMDCLQRLREKYGKPIVITSGYRDPEHSIEKAKVEKGARNGGAHVWGKAVDVSIRGAEALKFVVLAYECGFSGVGISQRGENRFVHIDTMEPLDNAPRPHIWSY